MKHKIALLLIYSDLEANLLAKYIVRFVKNKADTLSTMQGFELGVCSVEFQYNMRLIRNRISKRENLSPFEVVTNNHFIKIMKSVPGLIEFMTAEYDKGMQTGDVLSIKIEIERSRFIIPSYRMSDAQKKECYAEVKKLKLK